MTDAQSHSTRYGYDDSGHLTEVILADGRTVRYRRRSRTGSTATVARMNC
ncbi:hypothetical protein ACD892_24625 [Escherichia coli]